MNGKRWPRGALSVSTVGLAIVASGGWAGAADFGIACMGPHYRHRQPFPVEEHVSLSASNGAYTVALPDVGHPVNATMVSDSAGTLTVRANDLTFQYFKFTGQLFVKHRDGHLTRLACKPDRSAQP